MFSLYRNNFAAIDTYNKVALGPKSVMHTVKVKNWFKRMFQVMIALAETNSYYAYLTVKRKEKPNFEMSREAWKL